MNGQKWRKNYKKISIKMSNVWLPYTQMQNHLPQLEVESALGSKIFLKDGRALIDGVSSWWSVAHGYQNPHLVKAIQRQAQKLSHIMLAGFQNEQTYLLASRLADFTGLSQVFFSDSGSTAVEVAMKISWQYHINKGFCKKKKFVSFQNSYHGDTTGAMSLADLSCGMHQKFQSHLIENFCLKTPENEEELNKFADFLQKKQEEIAAVFIEPLVQCAGGMKFHDPLIISKICEIVKKNRILLVFDECAVGFYRLGRKFAYEFLTQKPDILILGKALTGGMMTLAATITTQEIYDAFLSNSINSALMHGPTFMGNPLACAVANSSLDLFEGNDYAQKVQKIENLMKNGLASLKNHDKVKDVRVFGAIGVVETDFDFDEMLKMRKKAIEFGVFLRPFAGVIYLMPPLVIDEVELKKLIEGVFYILN
jgi:adenosylmethionine-8-amino-7-oxononanoate aminotransferase